MKLSLYGKNEIEFDQINYYEDDYFDFLGSSNFVSMNVRIKINDCIFRHQLKVSVERLSTFLNKSTKLVEDYSDAHRLELLNEYEDFELIFNPSKLGTIALRIFVSLKDDESSVEVNCEFCTDLCCFTKFINCFKQKLNSNK